MTLTTLQLSEPYGKAAVHTSGEGDPVVLIHGVGMQSAAWAPQVEFLSKTHRVFAIDMPGHGGSDALPTGAQLPEFVAWLHAVLTALNVGPVNLAGHSMGALVSGGYAISHPDMVARVALLNGVYRRSDAARAAVVARADEISQGSFDLETPLTRWFGDSDTDKAACALVSGWLSGVNPDGYATAYGAFARGDATYADRFEDITCPLLAMTGDGDLNSSPEMSDAMAKVAPKGRAVIIKDHRHMVNLTAPDQVNDILKDWLNTPVSGGQND
ncbi:alpha/beta fold hydrolase [Halocynthiibacter styelae]|uniref:Alpha/beta hydrolase n=1 Tax=Halocynthiibacter styelae TaxID=2761955 RepID=A0A8J7ITJ9_9RHOB|nr:alpha/beta hydrolase [Paenihalocynthiibacter styelae]MBI1492784.1 alpha/beta hydrolase [Paenihalocynthiibacter styelae]